MKDTEQTLITGSRPTASPDSSSGSSTPPAPTAESPTPSGSVGRGFTAGSASKVEPPYRFHRRKRRARFIGAGSSPASATTLEGIEPGILDEFDSLIPLLANLEDTDNLIEAAAAGAAVKDPARAAEPGEANGGAITDTLVDTKTSSHAPRRGGSRAVVKRTKAALLDAQTAAPVTGGPGEDQPDEAGQMAKASAPPSAEPATATQGPPGKPAPLPPGELMDSEEARIFLRYRTLNALHQALRRNAIPCHKVGRRLLFIRSELEAYLAARTRGPRGG
jgi:hypothetical protein